MLTGPLTLRKADLLGRISISAARLLKGDFDEDLKLEEESKSTAAGCQYLVPLVPSTMGFPIFVGYPVIHLGYPLVIPHKSLMVNLG